MNSTLSTQHSTLIAGTVAALAAAVYANALANGLVWDDPIVLDRQLLAFRSLHDLIFTPRNIPQYSPDYYRPLTTLTYLIDRALGDTGAFMFHFSVVVLHVISTFLVFRLGLALFRGMSVALPAAAWGAALFAVHPIHSESVAWGAGRSDVIACAFAVGSALAYLRDDWTPMRRAAIAALLAFAAMLAKETAMTVLLILPASDFILQRRAAPIARPAGRAERRRQREQPAPTPSVLPILAPFVAALVAYIVLRQAALGLLFGQASPLGADGALKLIGAVGFYVGMLLLPIGQSAYISDLPTSLLVLLATIAVTGGALLAGIVAWRRGERRVPWLLLWLGVTLAPSLSIVLKIPNAPVAERYLYLPSVGFCLLVGYGAASLLQVVGTAAARYAVHALLAVLVALAAVATISRNAVWQSNMSLWTDTAAKNTTDGLPMRSLAAAYLDSGDTVKAAEFFQVALQRRNDEMGRFTIYNNLGSLAMHEEKLDAAERDYNTALAIDANSADTTFNLGLIALTRALETPSAHDADWKRDQAQRARRHFERAAQLNPLDPDTFVALGQTLTALDDSAGARAQYERALQLGLPPTTDTAVRKLLAELP